MKLFLIKGALFALPFTILLGFPLFVLQFSGELITPEKVIKLQQQKQPVLFGLGYSHPAKHFKLASTLERQPEVITLGNSRVSQFRSTFFRDSVNFYNATMAATTLSDFRYFLSQIPAGQEPELIILGLDHWWFNENTVDTDRATGAARFMQRDTPSKIFETTWRTVWSDYFDGKFTLSRILKAEGAIGLNALFKPLGFRNDGSIYYGHIIADPDNPELEDYQFKNSLRGIRTGKEIPWKYGQDVPNEALDETRRFLQKCAERGIMVIGFLPVYAHTVYEEMKARPEAYAYAFKLEGLLRPIFNEHGFEFYDFSDITYVGSSDEEALDGHHGSEKTHVRLVLQMIEQGSAIARYAKDPADLKERLQNADNNFEVFPTVM